MSLLSNNTVPNKPLTGKECAQVIVDNVRQLLDNDCMFNPSIAYRKLAFTVTVTVHAADLSDPKPRAEARTRVRAEGVIEGDAPLVNPPEDAQFMAVERTVTVDNPNVTRVHHDLPIRVQQKALPNGPNDLFPKIETQELRYEKGEFPPLTEPVDKDVTEREAKRLGVPLPAPMEPLPEVPSRRRGRPRKETDYNTKDAEDLEAISTEE